MSKEKKILIQKRSGVLVDFDRTKWSNQVATICKDIDYVSTSMIEIQAMPHFYDRMTTREIDEITLRAIVELIDEETCPIEGNTNYQFVAGRQLISMLRKDVYGQYNPPSLYEIITKNISLGLYTEELLNWYSKEEIDIFDQHIDHSKDEKLPYAAIEQMRDKYLLKNRSTEVLYESPQIRYMIAAMTNFHMETTDRTTWVKDYYDEASEASFTLATPVLAGLGTKTKQFSSCVLIKIGDSTKSIQAATNLVEDYASKRAGLGIDVSRIRALGAPVRNGEIEHTGLVPFLKKIFYGMRAFSQGGIRNSSATVTFQIWHYQFDDLIQLKNNRGIEETRVRHLDYSVAISALFFKRLKEGGNITFFDPNDLPDLYDAFYRDINRFNELYEYYEKNAVRLNIRHKVETADKVIRQWLIKERVETGRIYLFFVDNVNRQSTFDTSVFPVYMSNLCVHSDTKIQVKINNIIETKSIEEVVLMLPHNNIEVLSHNTTTNMDEFKQILSGANTGKKSELIKIGNAKVTPDHEIWTTNRGYVQAQYLTQHDILMHHNDIDITYTTIQEDCHVYDITVQDNRNFYADGLLVSNCQEILLPTYEFV
jgi:ribonucleoside-diphosphate reductase alpha chain